VTRHTEHLCGVQDIELVLNMLAEVTTTNLSRVEQPETIEQNKSVARRGGNLAKNTRTEYEQLTGQPALSSLNASNKELLEVKKQGKQ